MIVLYITQTIIKYIKTDEENSKIRTVTKMGTSFVLTD